ncbi:MAG: holo-ACP synthase [Acidimicrobiales bacterium]
MAHPGPFVIGIGVDLCEVDRMRAALARTPTLRARVFTDEEQAYCDRRHDPTERYAARFAAKEAVMKAMGVGVGACQWRDIEVAKAEGGAPSVRLHGGARALADERGIEQWHLTLTHTHRVAEAIAIAE